MSDPLAVGTVRRHPGSLANLSSTHAKIAKALYELLPSDGSPLTTNTSAIGELIGCSKDLLSTVKTKLADGGVIIRKAGTTAVKRGPCHEIVCGNMIVDLITGEEEEFDSDNIPIAKGALATADYEQALLKFDDCWRYSLPYQQMLDEIDAAERAVRLAEADLEKKKAALQDFESTPAGDKAKRAYKQIKGIEDLA